MSLNDCISLLSFVHYRPWYAEAATPNLKDVVLVIDKSGSMEEHGIMDLAKEAAKTVMLTLNPNDRVMY